MFADLPICAFVGHSRTLPSSPAVAVAVAGKWHWYWKSAVLNRAPEADGLYRLLCSLGPRLHVNQASFSRSNCGRAWPYHAGRGGDNRNDGRQLISQRVQSPHGPAGFSPCVRVSAERRHSLESSPATDTRRQPGRRYREQKTGIRQLIDRAHGAPWLPTVRLKRPRPSRHSLLPPPGSAEMNINQPTSFSSAVPMIKPGAVADAQLRLPQWVTRLDRLAGMMLLGQADVNCEHELANHGK